MINHILEQGHFWGEDLVILRGVEFIANKSSHSYSSGIITRIDKPQNEVWIAVKDGLLRVKEFSYKNKKKSFIKLGYRIHTPINYLENSYMNLKLNSKGF